MRFVLASTVLRLPSETPLLKLSTVRLDGFVGWLSVEGVQFEARGVQEDLDLRRGSL
jgi:hypothetical protein